MAGRSTWSTGSTLGIPRHAVGVLVAVGVASLACVSGPVKEEAPLVAPGTPPSPTPPPAPAPTGPPECQDNCLLLLIHDSKTLESGGYCEVCGDAVEGACDEGYALRAMGCDEMDYVRNCMYARLGYTFEDNDDWRAVFEKKHWYQPRSDFRWADIDRSQLRNAKRLKALREAGRCGAR